MERNETEREREREGKCAERQMCPIISPEVLRDLRGAQ